MRKEKRFIRIETTEVGRIDGMVVAWPSSESLKLYCNALNCFYNVGDRICLFDKSKFSGKRLSYMTNSDIWNAVFTDKNYILGTIEERAGFHLLCRNSDTVRKINRNQMYAETLRIKTDNREEFTCSPAYFCIMGRVIDEIKFDKSKTKCI